MKKVLTFLMSLMVLFAFYALPVMAQQDDIFGINYAANTGLGKNDPRDIIATVIKITMGFLGTIAVVVILIGGFKWMTAGGNDSKVGEAKKWIGYGIVGLIIVLSAYSITQFVLSQLISATGAGR